MYNLLRKILFWFDAERVHYFSMNALRLICNIPALKKMISKHFGTAHSNPAKIFDLVFKNKIGLGAGFDKNAAYLNELEALGFGFVEIGTVTPLPQGGNDKPRLFRLPKDKALINRMGFNNDGAEAIADRLKEWRQKVQVQNKKPTDLPLIIGVNIGKNKITPNEDAWQDYLICFERLHTYADYFVVNVSSPNTPGLRQLQEKYSLRKILTVLQEKNKSFAFQKPILLKIAPDLSPEETDDVIDLALEINLDGLVVANTTIERASLQTREKILQEIGPGGLSGLPLKNKSTEMIQYIAQQTKGRLPIIGCGGIFTGKDASEKIAAGASLVQVWTGFVYEGPEIVKKIDQVISV